MLGLALLWYVLGFASQLARDDLSGAPQGVRLALPLYPVGYARLFVGALVARSCWAWHSGCGAGEPAGACWWHSQ